MHRWIAYHEVEQHVRLRNKYWVQPSSENKAAYEKLKNNWVNIRRKSAKRFRDKISEKEIETSKKCYDFI